jgi:predicted HAD superfamily Cof-like phosphohydrolase
MTSTAQYALPMQRDVATFHDAFGSPNLIARPGVLPDTRIALRESLIREEGVVELGEAVEKNDAVLVIDALVDTLSVSLGALVEMGQQPQGLDTVDDGAPRDLDVNKLMAMAAAGAAANDMYLAILDSAFRRRDIDRAVEILTAISYQSLQNLVIAGIDPQPFFDEVQRANMSKLGADGKPVISRGMSLDGYPKGKVLKGPDYKAPDLASIYDELYVRPAEVGISPEFERGARAAAEAMRFYFLNEDENPMFDVDATELETFEQGAVRDAIRDEQLRVERLAA